MQLSYATKEALREYVAYIYAEAMDKAIEADLNPDNPFIVRNFNRAMGRKEAVIQMMDILGIDL